MTKQTYTEYIADLTKDDLIHLRAKINEKLVKIEEENKKIVWRLEDNHSIIHFYREEEYLQAVDHLKAVATTEWNAPKKYRADLHLRINSEKVPESEYEDYFK